MKKVFLILCSLALFILASNSTRIEASENLDNILNFFEDNILEFKTKYNQKTEDEEEYLSINYVEGYTLIFNQDYNKYCIYLDFDNDNGYLLTGFDFNIYLIENCGDLSYLKNVNFAYYNSIDGFVYKEDGSYRKYIPNSHSNIEYGAAGQAGDNDSYICDIDAYMNDRYPSYTFVTEEVGADHLDYFPLRQSHTSYYIKHISNNGGSTYYRIGTETNCVIHASYGMMEANRVNYVLPIIPSRNDVVDVYSTIESDPFYRTYGTGFGGLGIDYYWTINDRFCLEEMPVIYKQLRDYFVANCGYTPVTGLTIRDAEEAIEYVASLYGYGSFDLFYSEAFASLKIALNNEVPALVGVQNSIDYEDHMMVLLGYREYTYETGWWIFKETKTAYFFLVDDGHSGTTFFFDPNRASNLSTEFLYY